MRFDKIKKNAIVNYAVNDDEKRKVEILHDKYLLPIIELQPDVENWVMEFQSLILVYSFYFDYYVDEHKESYKLTSDKILDNLIKIAEKNRFSKTFLYYFKGQMYYMINEKDIKHPKSFYDRYSREKVKYKAYMFLAIKEYLVKHTYNIYRDYIIFNLLADDFIDFKTDRDNMVLTTLTSLLAFPEEKGGLLLENYNYMVDVSRNLEKCCSKTIKQVVDEFINYFQMKKIYDKVREELLKSDWNY